VSYFHGGIAGKAPGDILVPAPPHVHDGCPICVARAAGRVCTVGEYRLWLSRMGPKARPILEGLEGVDASEAIDPPSARQAVYITNHMKYARWYAARSHGSLYVVEPIGIIERSDEDPFPSWTCASATVVSVVDKRVRLTRKDRREMLKLWKRADAKR